MCVNNSQFYFVDIARKCIKCRYFYSRVSPLDTCTKLLPPHPRQREITHSSRQHFLKNLFRTTAESGGGNYDFLYQNLIKKYEDDLDYWAIYFWYGLYFFANVMTLQFCR